MSRQEEIAKAARAAVASIIEDLNDRSGLKRTWRQVEPGIQHEIREMIWEGLVVRALDVPAPSAPLIPQSRAEAVPGNETTNGKSFAVDVLGQPMREVSPGKWENYVPQSRADAMVAEERERCAVACEDVGKRWLGRGSAAFAEVAAAIRARKTETPSPERQKKEGARP